ncbi:MAG: DNA helicase PcrA [Tissierellia bacterium]|nr:DNA helicase PcrA [Tissierellia bacterium]
MDYIKGLNDRQREAVLHDEGPLLVLAGAGSGKTRVLTHRIAYLIEERGIFPGNILAITFTNKAADEMKERAIGLLSGNLDRIWMGTFHSICVRILRQHIDRIGFERAFSIYDRNDQIALMRECIEELGLNEDRYKDRLVLNMVGRIKDSMASPDDYIDERYMDPVRENMRGLYRLYEKKLKHNNALDFDDLIKRTVELFRADSDILEYYQRKFEYIFVDEFQDTNGAQYQLIRLLASGHRNLCVVGDDDQSIFGWRGADITNILSLKEDFHEAKTIKLEQNYRSTQNILDVANSIIKNNNGRMEKRLWTDRDRGKQVVVENVSDQDDEARTVLNRIWEHSKDGHYKLSDFAILYRTNAQSRVFEEAFMRNDIPYRLVGGLKFYDRKEIKDIIAYLRVIQNPVDDISLRRIINVPRRGIGRVTMGRVEEYARGIDSNIYDALMDVENIPGLSARARNSLRSFVDMMNGFMERQKAIGIGEFIEEVIEKVGYIGELEDKGDEEAQSRLNNIEEFLSVAVEFETYNPDGSLEDFLAGISLLSDVDKTEDRDDAVTLLTVHSAKGLEFPVVFMVGMEEGLFPIIRDSESDSDIEEERRLCYVAITRAEELLYISHARVRTIYGRMNYSKPSRFIYELPEDLIDVKGELNRDFHRGFNDMAINPNERLIRVRDYTRRPMAPSGRVAVDQDQIKEGTKVKHAKWGFGIVAQLKDRDDDREATIIFDDVGLKRLLLSIAPIEIVNGG